MTYYNEQTKERYLPYVIEPAAGADRTTLAFLIDAYDEEVKENGETRVVLHFHPKLAPVKVAVFPLMKKDGLDELAHKIENDLRESFTTFYDQSGAIGRRYARQDEIGTPFCVTVDYDSKTEGTVTLRLRDSMEQKRVKIEDLEKVIREEIKNWKRV